jgi:D-3-phosphoglycerate dehydrogenase / 2-oxoglutarate reductase
VDESALIRALGEGWIAGAALDVLESEPPAPDNALLAMPNVLVTPHTAGYSEEAFADNRRDTVEEVVRVLGGGWPTALVNPDVRGRARSPAPMV